MNSITLLNFIKDDSKKSNYSILTIKSKITHISQTKEHWSSYFHIDFIKHDNIKLWIQYRIYHSIRR